MKKIIIKYLLLIIVTFATSIFIYNYIMDNEAVNTEKDVLTLQAEVKF